MRNLYLFSDYNIKVKHENHLKRMENGRLHLDWLIIVPG